MSGPFRWQLLRLQAARDMVAMMAKAIDPKDQSEDDVADLIDGIIEQMDAKLATMSMEAKAVLAELMGLPLAALQDGDSAMPETGEGAADAGRAPDLAAMDARGSC